MIGKQHRAGRLMVGMVAVAGLIGCTPQAKQALLPAEKTQSLKDLSILPVGAGYDRALDGPRSWCFARDMKVTTDVREWEATGFTAFTSEEVGPKVSSAIVVGVKIENFESVLGTATANAVGTSGEQARFVTLARFTARRESAGAIRAAGSECLDVSSSSANGLADFVSKCGDSYLSQQTFGGHVLLSWKRSPARAGVDEMMGIALGARSVGATINLIDNLEGLSRNGLGQEALLIEVAGIPVWPVQVTLPNGDLGHTVDSVLEYLKLVLTVPASRFPMATDYEFTRFSVDDIDLCLAETHRQSSLPESEWACVHGHLSELVEARDGTGELAHFQDRYLEAKLVSQLAKSGRVVFNTVPQSRCPGIDADGDPNFEKSGPCQEKSVDDFVAFYEACTVQSGDLARYCRNDVLATVDTCSDFEAKNCRAIDLVLSSGATVTCTSDGMSAALADLVPWIVNPPFNPVQPPRNFQPPEVFLIDDFSPLPYTPQTHFCAITGLRGDLNAGLSIEQWNSMWGVLYVGASSDRAFRPQLEVTCTAWENFYFYNGGSHSVTSSTYSTPPLLNGTGYFERHRFVGVPFLAGAWFYLDEPQTELYVTNPDPTGTGSFYVKDLFPLATPHVIVGAFSIQASAPLSGAPAGGALGWSGFGPSEYKVGFDYRMRRTEDLARPLPANSFCFLTGLSGRYYNTSDWARVERSDGFATLRAATPLNKDRNPGIRVQCAYYDQP